ncbi:TdeIII family type II restriction endonuclease [Helicobacter sp. 13S00477-4]|uniref:TdeIII family type II restriction endonuclease n=1 Tax=Helicobacter sp. 13S00477-4 TaxID=1905759 RepID=UPI000BA7A893|nr:TdeIII family type II restriction endonuclease [Helicobacter sp. 13S00477-4]PAF52832.1 restriction endonuclease [Helicobacter sp. 13S00477-4]
MFLTHQQSEDIKNVLKNSLRNKFQNYQPETTFMPFHMRLLGKDRIALFSFIHSLNTNFGTTIFEPVALELAKTQFKEAKLQTVVGSAISTQAQRVIQDIMDDLTVANSKPDKNHEIQSIRKVCRSGEIRKIKPTKVDICLHTHDDKIYLIDIKTAKPNKGSFKEFKRTLLEWVACILFEKPQTEINTLIAIPYNPYEPRAYNRWTMAGMLDLDNELKVGEEFWDFLGGQGTYLELLDIFESVGLELRAEIDDYFRKYNELIN